ncbi:MAG TPA: hypothetical protein VGF67_02245 [Ktedonobacteraceae bacterium]|jgi:hypothetical protein
MTSIADGSGMIQISVTCVPAPLSWFGELVMVCRSVRKHGLLTRSNKQVRFARKRFGSSEVIEDLAVLFGSAVSGERTLEAFYERILPFVVPFLALFERDQLPFRSALSRLFAALTEAPVNTLRTLFLDDLLRRSLTPDKQTGSLADRAGRNGTVFAIDGTRESARQRALPQTDTPPPPLVGWITCVLLAERGPQARSGGQNTDNGGSGASFLVARQFGEPGPWTGPNGTAPEPGRHAPVAHGVAVPARTRAVAPRRARWQWGGALRCGGFCVCGARARAPDQLQQRPERQLVGSLSACPAIPVGPKGIPCRVIVATHPAPGRRRVPWG